MGHGRQSGDGGTSGVADDDSGTLFAQHTPLFGLGAPVPALFATEKSKHARWFFNLRILYERGALVSHFGPRTGLVENYLYASAHASTAL